MDLEQIRRQFTEELSGIKDERSLDTLEVEFLGRKGSLTEILRGLSGLSLVEKKRVGLAANELKVEFGDEIARKRQDIRMRKWEQIAEIERQDINDAGFKINDSGFRMANGHLHPLSNFILKIERVFEEMGYEVVEGYDIETDHYNFEAVRIPENHPSRDEHDTFYIKDLGNPERSDLLLRTQTTAMQVRYMEKHKDDLPIKVIVPGKCYRRDDDASHSPMFHQFEALVVDKGLTMGELKYMLSVAMKKILGDDTRIRFRSGYFPFVEPGLEVDVTCSICRGKGCNVCKNTGWVELLGAGMVHPEVLENGGIDPNVYSGFAFAMGIDRLAMMHHKIPNIKLLFENDIRFLDQF